MLTDDDLNERAETFISSYRPTPLLSDLAAAEFAATIGRRVRTRLLTLSEGEAALAAFDRWSANAAQRIECSAVDIAAASRLIRRLDLPLRAPDAIHIAIAQRSGVALATFDAQMAANARALGVSVADA